MGGILGCVGHKVKIHKITPVTGKKRGDLEIKDYVVLQKPQEQTDRLPPPRTLIVDFNLKYSRYGRSHVYSIGQMTNTRSSDGGPELDGVFRGVTMKKIFHYRQLYLDHPHRERSGLVHEIPEESGQFGFLHVDCFANIKGSV